MHQVERSENDKRFNDSKLSASLRRLPLHSTSHVNDQERENTRQCFGGLLFNFLLFDNLCAIKCLVLKKM
ncbi:CLUMA_CG015680, isoform A [Clunio marinus]|uniref:CLUMA_CG015680, isoform A n=1 Tax=Clunio marinus TaxID=568069 RepID=A0A1J1IQX3_9DIPT|nr:CLUMA_CG015680, isoform A [Clunio marinus]